MGEIAQTMDAIRAARLRATQNDIESDSQSILSRLLSPASSVFDAIDYVDSSTRALLGNIAGVQGSGRETPFGSAPSGRELLGLGAGQPGTVEAGDIPGTALELLASPLNLLGLGAATKTGRAASALANAGRRAEALTALGRVGEAAEYASRAAKLRTELEAAGRATQYGKTLGEQARLGQRSLLSLDVPFTDINVPLVRGAPALDAISYAGRTAAYPFKRALGPAFRRFGQAGAEQIGDEAARTAFNEIGNVSEEAARAGRREGTEQASLVEKFLRGRSRTEDAATLSRLASIAPDLVAVGGGAGDASQRLLMASVERLGVPEKLADLATRTTSRYEAKIAALEATIPKIQAMRDVAQRAADRLADPVSEINKAGMGAAKAVGPEAVAAERQLQQDAAGMFAKRDTNLPGVGRGVEDMTIQQMGNIRAQQAKILADADELITNKTATVYDRIAKARQKLAEKVAGIGEQKASAEALIKAIPDDVLNEANRIRTVLDGRLAQEAAAGVPVKPLADPMLSYANRAITPEGVANLAKLKTLDPESPFVRLAREINPEKGFVKSRVKAFDGMGITQINDWFRNELAQKGVKFGGNLFSEDMGDIMMRRLTQGGLATQAADMLRGLVERFHVPGEADGADLAEFLKRSNLGRLPGGIETAGDLKAIRNALKGTKYDGAKIPTDIANAALKTFQVFQKPEEMKQVGNFFTKYNALMRFWVTIPFPGYHVRNVAGNVFNSWLAGMSNPSYYGEAARLQKLAKSALLNPQGASDEATKALALVRKASDLGAMDATIIQEAIDLADMAGSQKAKAIGQSLLTPGGTTPYIGGMARMGHWLENNAKLALFLDGVRSKGMTYSDAAERVKKYLFNHGDLSRFEKDTLRKWAFFYSWQRKNIPLQFERLFADPRRMRAAGFALGYGGDNDSSQFLSEYQRGKANIDPRITDSEGNRMFFNVGLPIQSLFDYQGENKPALASIGTVARKVLSNLAPAAQIPLKLAVGQDLRSGRSQTVLETVGSLLPTSRVQSSVQQISDAASKGTYLDPALSLLGGVGVSRVNPEVGRMRSLLEKIDNRREALRQSGDAASFTEYYGKSPEAKKEINALSSLADSIRKRIKERTK